MSIRNLLINYQTLKDRALTISQDCWVETESKIKSIQNGNAELTEEDYSYLRNKYASQSVAAQAMNLLKATLHAGKSVIKTELLNIDKTSDVMYNDRLRVCEKCPGGHATFKDGKLYTCGPMLASAMSSGQGTCGCILSLKARDSKEHCPFSYWPNDGKKESGDCKGCG